MVPRRTLLSGATAAAATLLGGAALAASAGAYEVSGPNVAAAPAATASASTAMPTYPAAALNDGVRQTRDGYWNDTTPRAFPDWAQIAWPAPRSLDRIVLRLPVAGHLSAPQRTLGPIELSWWDAGAGAWRAIAATGGSSNPVASWVAPASADGSEVRSFDFAAVTTDKVRVTYSGGNSDGWSFLEEIEAYSRRAARAPLRATAIPVAANELLQPGDEAPLQVKVTDADGQLVGGYPVTFASVAARGRRGAAIVTADADPGVAGVQVLTGADGRASATARTATRAGADHFTAGTLDAPAAVRFTLRPLKLDRALQVARDWLEDEAAALQQGSRMRATDGTWLYTPDGSASYAALWTRDFQYMVEGYPEGIPAADVRANIEYLMRAQRADGALADHVETNGLVQYCPGSNQCGSFGPAPALDNSQFTVKLFHDHWKKTGDLTLFSAHAERLVRAMEFTPRSPDNALTYISPDPLLTGAPYGFTDTIRKTGDQLYDSLLYVDAARELSELFKAAGDRSQARRWRNEAWAVHDDLQTLWDRRSGMFLAASLQNRQIDIWGSALAVRLGVTTKRQARRVAGYLHDNYDGVVRRGQVRHTAPDEYWEFTMGTARGTYQNGAYWATPSGDVALAISLVDRRLARQMLVDMTKDFMANGVNEAFNDDLGYVAVPKYVVSATNPIPAMNELLRGGGHRHRR